MQRKTGSAVHCQGLNQEWLNQELDEPQRSFSLRFNSGFNEAARPNLLNGPSAHPGRPVVIRSVTASSKGLSQQPGRSIKDANYLGPLGAANYGCTGG